MSSEPHALRAAIHHQHTHITRELLCHQSPAVAYGLHPCKYSSILHSVIYPAHVLIKLASFDTVMNYGVDVNRPRHMLLCEIWGHLSKWH